MRDFFKSTKFKVLLGIFAFLIGIMVYTATTFGGKSVVSSFFGMVFSPIQKFSTSISNKVTSTLDMVLNAKEYYTENEKLRKKLDELYSQTIDYDTVKNQNKQFKEMLSLKENNSDFEFAAPATIIGRATNDIYQSFYIDKGTSDGIKLNDPVIVGNDLIGIVSDVETVYSKVTTVLSPEHSYGVVCSRNNDTGLIQGNLELAAENLIEMKHIDRKSDIKKGDIVVTVGYSGLVPAKRIVGTVKEVEIDKGGLSLTAIVEPNKVFTEINDVFVITKFKGQGAGYDE